MGNIPYANYIKRGGDNINQNVDWQGYRITNLADPVDAQDAVTKAYLTSVAGNYLPLAGGTLTGGLTIDGSANEVQLKVQGNATQTANVFEVEDSASNTIFFVDVQYGWIGLTCGNLGLFQIDALSTTNSNWDGVFDINVETNANDAKSIASDINLITNDVNITNIYAFTSATVVGAAGKTISGFKSEVVGDVGDTDRIYCGYAANFAANGGANTSYAYYVSSTAGGWDYALKADSGDIYLGAGDCDISGDITGGTITMTNAINEFSTDGTLAGNSDSAVPTEKATKTYIDAAVLAEDFWDRAGDDISPKNANDDVLPNTTGDIGAAGTRWSNIYGTNIDGTTLTDGTASITGGVITGATNVNWDAAFTHISNDGTDHSFINQNVTSAGTPTFASITMTNTVNEFSTDGTLGDNSDSAVPTEKAVRTYVTAAVLAEDFWDRAGTALYPKNANDDIIPNTSGDLGQVGNRFGNIYGTTLDVRQGTIALVNTTGGAAGSPFCIVSKGSVGNPVTDGNFTLLAQSWISGTSNRAISAQVTSEGMGASELGAAASYGIATSAADNVASICAGSIFEIDSTAGTPGHTAGALYRVGAGALNYDYTIASVGQNLIIAPLKASIIGAANGNITYIAGGIPDGGTAGYVSIDSIGIAAVGSSSPTQTLDEDSLYIKNILEVDGVTHLDGHLIVSDTTAITSNLVELQAGADGTPVTSNAVTLGVTSYGSGANNRLPHTFSFISKGLNAGVAAAGLRVSVTTDAGDTATSKMAALALNIDDTLGATGITTAIILTADNANYDYSITADNLDIMIAPINLASVADGKNLYLAGGPKGAGNDGYVSVDSSFSSSPTQTLDKDSLYIKSMLEVDADSYFYTNSTFIVGKEDKVYIDVTALTAGHYNNQSTGALDIDLNAEGYGASALNVLINAYTNSPMAGIVINTTNQNPSATNSMWGIYTTMTTHAGDSGAEYFGYYAEDINQQGTSTADAFYVALGWNNAFKSEGGSCLYDFRASDQFYIDADTIPHTGVNGVLKIDVDSSGGVGSSAIYTTVTASTAATGLSGIISKMISGAANTGGEWTKAFSADMTTHAGDTDHTYVGYSAETFTELGTTTNIAFYSAAGWDAALYAHSGDIVFDHYAATIYGMTTNADGDDLTIQAAHGDGTNKDGGDLILEAGDSTGSGTDGIVQFPLAANSRVYIDAATTAHTDTSGVLNVAMNSATASTKNLAIVTTLTGDVDGVIGIWSNISNSVAGTSGNNTFGFSTVLSGNVGDTDHNYYGFHVGDMVKNGGDSNAVAFGVSSGFDTCFSSQSGSASIKLGATQNVLIDAATTDNTYTQGVFRLNVDTSTDGVDAMVIDMELSDALGFDEGVVALKIIASSSAVQDDEASMEAIVVELEGNAGDGEDMFYAGLVFDGFENHGSDAEAAAIEAGEGFSELIYSESGDIVFGDYEATIMGAAEEDGPDLNIHAANGGMEGAGNWDGGVLNLAGGALAGTGVDGWTTIGDGGTTDYTKFDLAGIQTMIGDARVTVDNYITASGVKAPGTKPATFVEYGICGAWRFADQGVAANQEQISGTLKLPTQMDKSVAPMFKVGWSANGVSPGNAEWQLEYLYRSPNEDTTDAAQATITVTSTASATSDGLVIAAFAALALASATDQALFFRITRLSAGGNDTIADDVEVRGMLFTHTRDTLGTAL